MGSHTVWHDWSDLAAAATAYWSLCFTLIGSGRHLLEILLNSTSLGFPVLDAKSKLFFSEVSVLAYSISLMICGLHLLDTLLLFYLCVKSQTLNYVLFWVAFGQGSHLSHFSACVVCKSHPWSVYKRIEIKCQTYLKRHEGGADYWLKVYKA